MLAPLSAANARGPVPRFTPKAQALDTTSTDLAGGSSGREGEQVVLRRLREAETPIQRLPRGARHECGAAHSPLLPDPERGGRQRRTDASPTVRFGHVYEEDAGHPVGGDHHR